MAAYSDAATDVTHGRASDQPERPHAKGKGHDDEVYSELLGALQQEEAAACDYLDSDVAVAQIDALRRYYGDKYGDEVEGCSQITTREVFESVEWLRPSLRRVFTAGGRIVDFEANKPEDDAYVDEAADLVNYVFFQDNPGEKLLDEFIFDGLLQRNGFLACDWLKAEYSPAQEVEGLNFVAVQAMMADPDTQIDAQTVEQGVPDPAHPDGLFYTLKIRKRTKLAKAECFTVAPEDMLISARAVDLETAPYSGDVMRIMKGDAQKRWPDYADEIDAYEGRGANRRNDERRAERFREIEGVNDPIRRASDKAQEVEILREYIYYDKDEDGYPELLRVFRIGDCILDCDEVDEHIYSTWTPTPVPHKLYGLSINDEAADLQQVKTVLTRAVLDSAYHTVNPRIAANQNKVDLDDLLSVRAGAVIKCDDDPGGALMPVPVTDMSGSGIAAMQWVDQVLEVRTGVTRHAQGLNPDALNHTARGIELLQNASNERKEQYAHNLAIGLQCFFRKLYRLLVSHQNEARTVKIAGAWRTIDPRKWNADLRVSVSVGLGTGARDAQLTMLSIVQADQERAVAAWGPQNPVVRPTHILATVEEKLRVMGFKDKTRFFGDPVDPQTGAPWVPQPAPNPDQQKLQASIQEGQLKLKAQVEGKQLDFKLEQMKAQAQMETDARADAVQREARAAQSAMDAEIARYEAEGRLQIAREEAESKAALAWAQFEFEKEMKLREFDAQQELARLRIQTGGASGAPNGSDTQFGGNPG